jgi:hypothetical protein
VPRHCQQSLLKTLDPANKRSAEEVRADLMAAHMQCMKLLKPKNMEHLSMTLQELLDTVEMFHLIEDTGEGWSVVRWRCSCTDCYQWVCCGHEVIFKMLLNASKCFSTLIDFQGHGGCYALSHPPSERCALEPEAWLEPSENSSWHG